MASAQSPTRSPQFPSIRKFASYSCFNSHVPLSQEHNNDTQQKSLSRAKRLNELPEIRTTPLFIAIQNTGTYASQFQYLPIVYFNSYWQNLYHKNNFSALKDPINTNASQFGSSPSIYTMKISAMYIEVTANQSQHMNARPAFLSTSAEDKNLITNNHEQEVELFRTGALSGARGGVLGFFCGGGLITLYTLSFDSHMIWSLFSNKIPSDHFNAAIIYVCFNIHAASLKASSTFSIQNAKTAMSVMYSANSS